MSNKICEVCGQEKPAEAFSKSYKNRCRQCVAELARYKRLHRDNSQIQPDWDNITSELLESQPDWEARRYSLALSLFRSNLEPCGCCDPQEAATEAVTAANIFINTIKNNPL